MKKIFLIVQKKDLPGALDALRDVGTVHIQHERLPRGSKINELRQDIQHLQKALGILADYAHTVKQIPVEAWHERAREIFVFQEEIDKLQENISKCGGKIRELEPWGDFNPHTVQELQSRRLSVAFLKVPAKQLKSLPEDAVVEKIRTHGGHVYCVVVTDRDIDLPFPKISLPQKSLSRLKKEKEEDYKKQREAVEKLKSLGCYTESFQKILADRQSALEFEEAAHGVGDHGHLVFLKGFCPKDQCTGLEKTAQTHRWGLILEDPSDEDEVPTLLKNSKWAGLSAPVLDVVEISPGYRELDVSSIFIIFFTLFFAMLIGDAAYGVIFALLAFAAQRKLKNKIKDAKPFHLVYLLTGFTVIWGVLTGTYFGQQWLPNSVQAVFPWLNETKNIQWLCFTIALVHLSAARMWRTAIQFPRLTALAEVGRLLIIWGMYFLVNMFVLSKPFPPFAGWFFKIGIPLALFFMVPFKKLLKTLPQEIIPFFLSVIGAGTDIVSYIRLFAVGLATVAVADAANAMPQDLPAFGIGYFFMIFLHVLNMILAAMAILVHAVRLNVLEFSGQLNLEWLGFKYHPFQRRF